MATIKNTSYQMRSNSFDRNTDFRPDRSIALRANARTIERTRTGNLQPRWRQLIANQQNATTNLNGTYMTVNRHRNYMKLKFRTGIPLREVEQEVWGDLASFHHAPINWAGGWTSNADNRARAEIINAIRKLQVHVSGPTFLGELRETVRMLKKPASALVDNLADYLNRVERANRENRRRYFRKKRATYDRNLSKIASGLWLEHAFGWTPLLHDIGDALDTYAGLFVKDRSVWVSRGGKDVKSKGYFISPQLAVPGSRMWFNSHYKDTESVVVRYKALIKAQAATTALEKWARWGFTPSEFVPTAWELLPWSFLIDYFSNIGDILTATVTDLSVVRFVNKDTINTAERYVAFVPDHKKIIALTGADKILTLHSSTGFVKYRKRDVSRVPDSGISPPSLFFTYPSSEKRLLNVAALLDQVGLKIRGQFFSRRNWRL